MSSTTLSPSVAAGQRSRPVNWGRFATVGAGAVAAAGVANVVVYGIGDLFVRYDPKFVELGSALGVSLFTMALAIVAALVYAVLLLKARNPERTFTIVSGVVLAVSLIPNVVLIPNEPGYSMAQDIVLMAMHAVAAVVIVRVLTTLAHPRSR